MKRLISLLLILCLLPTGAWAEREKTYGLTEAELHMLHARYDELLEQTVPDLAYPECCQGMSDKDGCLLALLTYDSYLRTSGGLCAFLLECPEMLPDVYIALYMVGCQEHSEALRAFTRDMGLADWGGQEDSGLQSFRMLGFLSRTLAHAQYGFDAYDEYVEGGAGEALGRALVRFISLEEPLWREGFVAHMTTEENIAYAQLWSLTDAPWPECAAHLSQPRRDLCLAWLFLTEWECGGLAQWLANTEPGMLADTPAALARLAPDADHTAALTAFCRQTGLDLSDENWLAEYKALCRTDYEAACAALPFDDYDTLLTGEPLRKALNLYVVEHPEEFR